MGSDPVDLLTCNLESSGHLQQISPKYQIQFLGAGKIFGQIQGAVFFQPHGPAVIQHFCHKLGTEIVVLFPERDPQHKSHHHPQTAVVHRSAVAAKGLKRLFCFVINGFGNIQTIQCAGKRSPSGLVISGNTFHNESLIDKAVEGVQVFLQSQGSMGIGKPGPQLNCPGVPAWELRQENIELSGFHLDYFTVPTMPKAPGPP